MGWIKLISREDLTLHCLIYLINGRLLIIRIADMRIVNNRPFMRYIEQCKVKSSLEFNFIHPI